MSDVARDQEPGGWEAPARRAKREKAKANLLWDVRRLSKGERVKTGRQAASRYGIGVETIRKLLRDRAGGRVDRKPGFEAGPWLGEDRWPPARAQTGEGQVCGAQADRRPGWARADVPPASE